MPRIRHSLLSALLITLLVTVASGALYTWDGDDGAKKNDWTWGQKKNWDPENQGRPQTGDDAVFGDSGTAGRRTVVLEANTVTNVDVTGTGSWTWSGGTLSVAGTFTYSSSGDSLFDGVLNGAGSLVIAAGAGEFAVTNDNTCAGNTNVQGGKLHVKNGGRMRNSGVRVTGGGKIYGNGRVKSLTVEDGGITAPGESPGTTSVDTDETWGGAGIYEWEINDVDATKGGDPGWDWKDIDGSLNITATSGDKFVIDITSLKLDNTAGDIHDFVNTQQYSWVIATAANGITGFAEDKFTLKTDNFSNGVGDGYFTISTQDGAGSEQSIALNFVPEPAAISFVLIGAAALLLRRRRRRAT